MPANIDIRAYRPEDEPGLIALWNETMWADPIEQVAWRTRYLLDPNFAAEACPVAVDTSTGDIVGFVLGFTDRSSGQLPTGTRVVGFGVRKRARRRA